MVGVKEACRQICWQMQSPFLVSLSESAKLQISSEIYSQINFAHLVRQIWQIQNAEDVWYLTAGFTLKKKYYFWRYVNCTIFIKKLANSMLSLCLVNTHSN